MKGSQRPRALLLSQVGDAIHAKFGFLEPGARLGPILVTVDAGGTLTLKTKADSTVVLTPVDANSMVNTFALRDDKAVRATAARSTPQAIASQLAGGGPSKVAVAATVDRAPSPAAAPTPAAPKVGAATAPMPDAVIHFIWMGGNTCPP